MVKYFYPVVWMLIILTTLAQAISFDVHKRQSDQRVAELETLLALRKYGVSSGPRKVEGRNSPGYGLIDFNYVGRRKKSIGRGRIIQDGLITKLPSSSPSSSSSSSFWPSEFSSRAYEGISSMKSPAATYLLMRKGQ